MRCGQFDGLVELATICALCNDSALDYNEVGPYPLSVTSLVSRHSEQTFLPEYPSSQDWRSLPLGSATPQEHCHSLPLHTAPPSSFLSLASEPALGLLGCGGL